MCVSILSVILFFNVTFAKTFVSEVSITKDFCTGLLQHWNDAQALLLWVQNLKVFGLLNKFIIDKKNIDLQRQETSSNVTSSYIQRKSTIKLH